MHASRCFLTFSLSLHFRQRMYSRMLRFVKVACHSLLRFSTDWVLRVYEKLISTPSFIFLVVHRLPNCWFYFIYFPLYAFHLSVLSQHIPYSFFVLSTALGQRCFSSRDINIPAKTLAVKAPPDRLLFPLNTLTEMFTWNFRSSHHQVRLHNIASVRRSRVHFPRRSTRNKALSLAEDGYVYR